MTRSLRESLEDILKYAQTIQKQTLNISFEEFQNNDEKILSVMMAFMIIGEATKNVPDEFRCLYPQVEWRKMAGMRDKIIHEYSRVDLRVLWNTSQKKIPELIVKMEVIVNEQST